MNPVTTGGGRSVLPPWFQELPVEKEAYCFCGCIPSYLDYLEAKPELEIQKEETNPCRRFTLCTG